MVVMVMLGLEHLRGLFQPQRFYDCRIKSTKNCDLDVCAHSTFPQLFASYISQFRCPYWCL